eukprot:11369898-Heterocapsa_arctica.AAC.1
MNVLDKHSLCCANTFYPEGAGSTWTDGLRTSRIDYMIIPRAFLLRVQGLHISYRTARIIQLSSASQWIDHAPVVADVWHRDWHDIGHTIFRWTRALQQLFLTSVESRRHVADQVEQWAQDPRVEASMGYALHKGDVNAAWDILNEGVQAIALPFFVLPASLPIL